MLLVFLLLSTSLSLTLMAAQVPVKPSNALQIFRVIGQLKTLKRTGWVNHGIPLPESVADHMYRMSMLGFLITDAEVNKDRLIKICLCHDLAEAVVGDITPHDGVSKEDKRRLEEEALKSIIGGLEHDTIAGEIMDLWLEYEEGTSRDAQVARNLDKFEMIVQADEYERANPGKHLDQFFESTRDYFDHPEVAAWARELRDGREARLRQEL